MFLVLGITGKVGGATARHLLGAGRQVRALVRDPRKAAAWARQGVELREGDFADSAGLAAALQGVEGTFLMLPPFFTPGPGFPEAKAIVDNFRDAVHRSNPGRIVALSAVGSQQTSGLGMITATHLLEAGLNDPGCPISFVRAGSFLENYVQSLDRAFSTGVFDTYLTPTERGFPMVATDDIGSQVARLLVDGWSGRKLVELGSRISSDDLARAMGEVLGRPVQARAVPREQWTASLEARGMPAGFIEPYLEMEDGYNSGWIDFGVPGAEQVSGTTGPAQVFGQARKAQQ